MHRLFALPAGRLNARPFSFGSDAKAIVDTIVQ
jgi:hypothetical protein